MRIAYAITRADAVGGASVHVLEMAPFMIGRGHHVMVFIGGAGPVTERLAGAGVPYRPLRFLGRAVRPIADLRALDEMTAALGEFQPDLVSTHTAKAGWIGRAACARLGVAAIHTPHGWPLGARMPEPGASLFRLAERRAGTWARAVVCVCEYERQLALAHRLAQDHRLHVIPNGVRDLPEAPRASPAASRPRIVSVARFEPPKDHATLLDALAGLSDLEWQLDLVGDGPCEPAARARAARLGIAGRVRFLGFLKDVAPALARAHIFVLASRSEALPRSLLEAMRTGLAVVSSRVGGVSEAIDDGSSGLLVPPQDAPALAQTLRSLIGDAERRQRLGKSARLAYEARFRLERMAEETASLYETVLAGRGDY
jgi:glycosyltransferase involved in cell wall biosynthesis